MSCHLCGEEVLVVVLPEQLCSDVSLRYKGWPTGARRGKQFVEELVSQLLCCTAVNMYLVGDVGESRSLNMGGAEIGAFRSGSRCKRSRAVACRCVSVHFIVHSA